MKVVAHRLIRLARSAPADDGDVLDVVTTLKLNNQESLVS